MAREHSRAGAANIRDQPSDSYSIAAFPLSPTSKGQLGDDPGRVRSAGPPEMTWLAIARHNDREDSRRVYKGPGPSIVAKLLDNLGKLPVMIDITIYSIYVMMIHAWYRCM